MQVMNAMGYQGIFEAAEHKLNEAGGIMLWKLNAAFPSVVWQIYDWFLMPNAGYYFIQNACKPVHVQFNRDDSTVVVINRPYNQLRSFEVTADIYSEKSKLIGHKEVSVDLNASEIKECFSLAGVLKDSEELTFILLRLKDASGALVSANTYWISRDGNFKGMKDMPVSELKVGVLEYTRDGAEATCRLQFTNPGLYLASFINPQVRIAGEEILPSYWSDNYFTLKPKESVVVTVRFPLEYSAIGKPELRIEGWNVKMEDTLLEP